MSTPENPAKGATPAKNGSSPPFPMDTKVNILLVDDEARNLDVLESSLESPEYNLVRALTAERALLLLLEGEFAAIVLDIQMPGMSGIELAALIKQRRRTQHIPIIFLTAYFLGDKDVLEGYVSGAVDYLTKPINPQILRSKIGVFADLFRKTQALALTNSALELEINQRQKAEESLRESNNELESRVEARTADIVRVNQELLEREHALRASEAQLRLVTDYAPVFMIQCDREHRVKFVNRTCADHFGFEPQAAVGQPFSEVMGNAVYVACRSHFDATLAGRRVEFETEFREPRLASRWYYVIQEPERSPEGDVVGLVAVITDITERKLAEQEVASARDKALAASRTKDDFMARLSHELRTPLSPVLLLASDAAANPDLPPGVRADFETIAQNVMLEARLIDDLLDLTAITRGKLALKMRPVEIHTILHQSLAMVRHDFTQKELRIVLKLEAERHIVIGDDMRLKQIFWNVIKNAGKFTPVGGKITVETVIDPENSSLLVRISDTGIGMTDEEIARIFAAFAQGDHATDGASPFGGLGLGLVISRMLVQLHSGTIRASSGGRDHGSVFTIELPLSAVKTPSTEPFEKIHIAPIATGDRGARRPLRILLVEDHKPTCATLTALLTRRHYQVLSANSVTEAHARAKPGNFDFVISDIGLPDGNGCDLMAELRDRYGLVGIALTGYGMDEDMNRSRASGFITHLTKPIRVQALDQALALVADSKRRNPSLSEQGRK